MAVDLVDLRGQGQARKVKPFFQTSGSGQTAHRELQGGQGQTEVSATALGGVSPCNPVGADQGKPVPIRHGLVGQGGSPWGRREWVFVISEVKEVRDEPEKSSVDGTLEFRFSLV